MMKTIFERETEVGRCAQDRCELHEPHYGGEEYSSVLVHTKGWLSGHDLVRIEQHCFLRLGQEFPDQPWIKPVLILEAALESEEELVHRIEKMHSEFVERVQLQFPQQYLV